MIRAGFSLAAFLVAGFSLLSSLGPARAVDHGQMGQTWPVIEPDLMTVIHSKLKRAEASGRLEELNRQFADRVRSRVMRPVPVAGIRPAEETRSWQFDPSIVVENDIRDHKGNLVAVAGQKVNPLVSGGLSKKLVFVDGDSVSEVQWALDQGSDLDVKVIFVDGSPFELMKRHQRRFYFDQSGKLTSHFGITRTPALVEREGDVLRVTESAISRRGDF